MIADEMRERLAVLNPTRLEIIDESARHRGHAGMREAAARAGTAEPPAGTHLRIRMASPAFAGLDRLARHRLVHRTLGDIPTRLHALALELAES